MAISALFFFKSITCMGFLLLFACPKSIAKKAGKRKEREKEEKGGDKDGWFEPLTPSLSRKGRGGGRWFGLKKENLKMPFLEVFGGKVTFNALIRSARCTHGRI